MVDIAMIDPERAAQIMGRRPEAQDDIAAMIGEQLRPGVRILVPLKDQHSDLITWQAMEDVADILIQLGNTIKLLARRRDLSHARVVLSLQRESKAAHHRIQDTTKYSKQK